MCCFVDFFDCCGICGVNIVVRFLVCVLYGGVFVEVLVIVFSYEELCCCGDFYILVVGVIIIWFVVVWVVVFGWFG